MNRIPLQANQVPEGWDTIVKALLDELEAVEGWKHEFIAQAKTKFGGLRFYTHAVPEAVYEQIRPIIAKYESLSCKTCETCGKPALGINDKGWYRTACEEHRNRS